MEIRSNPRESQVQDKKLTIPIPKVRSHYQETKQEARSQGEIDGGGQEKLIGFATLTSTKQTMMTRLIHIGTHGMAVACQLKSTELAKTFVLFVWKGRQ